MDEIFYDITEEDLLPILEVRVLDSTKKTGFRVRRLARFPVAETIADMKSALQMFMPDIADVDNGQIGYILERNKKYTIKTNSEQKNAFEEFKKGYQMWLDPSPVNPTASKRKSGTNGKGEKRFSIYLYELGNNFAFCLCTMWRRNESYVFFYRLQTAIQIMGMRMWF